MSNPPNPRQEQAGTYVVQDRSNEEELIRVSIQDRMLTSGMGGVLPEQPDPTSLQRVLDVGCGAGEWLIEVAKTYPTIGLLVGVDLSSRMVRYALSKAEAQQVSGRVHFQTMDALQMLEFPTDFFDLVNLRLGLSFLRTWDWPKLLHEFQRVTRPGGVVRITESDQVVTSSPAQMRYIELLGNAFHQAGYTYTREITIASELARLLRQYGLQEVQTRSHTMEYRVGSVEWQAFYDDTRHAMRTIVPFMRKWAQVPDDYEALCQQALSEMQQPDFVATWTLLTAWGTKLSK
jgi:ubiquinone/menaquinone biosynthesis C-methylase UbiE